MIIIVFSFPRVRKQLLLWIVIPREHSGQTKNDALLLLLSNCLYLKKK